MFSLKCFADPFKRGARSGARLFSSASRHTLSLKVILKIRPGKAILATNTISGEFAAANQAANCHNVDSQIFSHLISRK